MNLTRKWFLLTCIFAFPAFISFCQINSYWADQHHFNGLFGWLGIGLLLTVASVYCLYKTIKYGGGSKE